jgi:hypothetical protein
MVDLPSSLATRERAALMDQLAIDRDAGNRQHLVAGDARRV